MSDEEIELAVGDTLKIDNRYLLTVVDIENGEARFHVEDLLEQPEDKSPDSSQRRDAPK